MATEKPQDFAEEGQVIEKEERAKEVPYFGRQHFDPELITVLRVGAEGTEPDERYSAFIENQELLELKSGETSTVTKETLLSGSIGDLLITMIEYVKLGMDYHAAKTGSAAFEYNGKINTYTPAEGGEKLNTAYERWLAFKANPKKLRISITGKQQRTEPDELVMDNIGKCEIYASGNTEPDYIVNIVGIVIEKDTSGGLLNIPGKTSRIAENYRFNEKR